MNDNYFCEKFYKLKKIIIAIDGYAGCGKSTTAKCVAKELDYIFIDTGAMYRAVTYYFITHQIPIIEPTDELLSKIQLRFQKVDNQPQIFLNDQPVYQWIRTKVVNEHVSQVSALKKVRRFLVHQQQEMGQEKGIVMDGRDIGTVVFPNAELKIFMQASMEARVKRRFSELQAMNISMTMEEIQKNLEERDYQDVHRTESPLKKAEDAFVIDTTFLTIQEQVDYVLKLAYEKIYS